MGKASWMGAGLRSETKQCPLVMIEWEDSAQPISSWSHLSDLPPQTVIRCSSVGWLIQDTNKIKVLAPNMGAIDDEANMQVSGVMRIPARCVIKLTKIREPILTSSLARSAPSSRPVTRQKRRASLNRT